MNHRRPKAYDSQSYYESPQKPSKPGIGFHLINTTRPPRQLGVDACISSRITTVIQVVGTIK